MGVALGHALLIAPHLERGTSVALGDVPANVRTGAKEPKVRRLTPLALHREADNLRVFNVVEALDGLWAPLVPDTANAWSEKYPSRSAAAARPMPDRVSAHAIRPDPCACL